MVPWAHCFQSHHISFAGENSPPLLNPSVRTLCVPHTTKRDQLLAPPDVKSNRLLNHQKSLAHARLSYQCTAAVSGSISSRTLIRCSEYHSFTYTSVHMYLAADPSFPNQIQLPFAVSQSRRLRSHSPFRGGAWRLCALKIHHYTYVHFCAVPVLVSVTDDLVHRLFVRRPSPGFFPWLEGSSTAFCYPWSELAPGPCVSRPLRLCFILLKLAAICSSRHTYSNPPRPFCRGFAFSSRPI